MADWLTGGLSSIAAFFGGERQPIAQNNLSMGVSLQVQAAVFLLLGSNTSKTTVAGTRYYSSFSVGPPSTPTGQDGAAVVTAPVATITGIQVLVGSVGGTDNWIVELHDASGNLLATSATAGTLAGTAGTWQQIPFTATYTIAPGTYYLTVQSNGTTAHFAVYNFPAPVVGTSPLVTGSATGTFGTGAGFTPATTYASALGPVALLY